MICPNCGYDNLPGNESCTNCQQDLTPLDRPIPQNKVERSLMEDRVSTLNPHPAITVGPDMNIREAIQIMLNRNIGALLVTDEEKNLLGIFSERDLLKKIAGIYDNLDELKVGDFMTSKPETVNPAEPLNFALHRMDIGGYRHVPIVAGGKPVGMISVRDMLRHITRACQEK